MKRKELDGTITLLINQDETVIEIEDRNAAVKFIRITLTPEQLSMALSRLSYTPCKIEVSNLDVVGKKMEHKQVEFELPKGTPRPDEDVLRKSIQQILDEENEGWICDGYFGSQNSFYSSKDGKYFAKARARRWV